MKDLQPKPDSYKNRQQAASALFVLVHFYLFPDGETDAGQVRQRQWRFFARRFPQYLEGAELVRLAVERGIRIHRSVVRGPDFFNGSPSGPKLLKPLLLSRIFPDGDLPTTLEGKEEALRTEAAQMLREIGRARVQTDVYESTMTGRLRIPHVDRHVEVA